MTSVDAQRTAGPANPLPSQVLLVATYAMDAVGVAVAFGVGFGSGFEQALQVATVFLVVIAGLASFARHSLVPASDSARMGWQGGPFLIEVGLANAGFAAGGLVALAGGWGTPALAAVCIAYGTYLLGALVFILLRAARGEGGAAVAVRVAAFTSVVAALYGFALAGLSAAGTTPF